MMTTTPRPATRCAPPRARTSNPHRALVAYLHGPAPATDVAVPPRPGWEAVGDLLVQGTACGAGIGFVVGGLVGVWFFVVGAFYGAPIGAVVGAVVGLPASVVLAAVLDLAADGQPATVRRRTATTLALLLEALVAWLLVWAYVSDTGDDRRQRMLIAVPAIVVYGALVAWMLRRSGRRLADRWNDRNGWTAVRP
jgi:hypothetical protein